MKRLPAFALFVGCLTLPLYAQRSVSRAGFSGHSAPAFLGGPTVSLPHSFTGAPRYTSSRPPSLVSGFRSNAPANYAARPAYSSVSPYRRPYVSPYRVRIPYAVPAWIGWAGTGYLGYPGYPGTTGYGDQAAPPDAAPYESQPFDQGQPAPSNPYQISVESPHPSPVPESEDAVTLVFKDGRAPEQIHN